MDGRFFDGSATAENDQVGKRNLFASGLGAVKLSLNAIKSLEHFPELRAAPVSVLRASRSTWVNENAVPQRMGRRFPEAR